MLLKNRLSIFLILISIFLFGLNIYGVLSPNDYRDKFQTKTLSYKDTIDKIDYNNQKYGNSKKFLKKAVEIYNQGIVYVWPEEYTKIPARENYILFLFYILEKYFFKIALSSESHIFSQFESSKYQRALGRGFGICSQNAIGLADLLYDRYNIKSYVTGLNGHVIVESEINKEKYILDPSVGVFIPLPLVKLEDNLSIVKAQYINYPDLAKTYNKYGNVVSSIPGGSGQRPMMAKIEVISDLLKWILPVLLFFLGFKMMKYNRR